MDYQPALRNLPSITTKFLLLILWLNPQSSIHNKSWKYNPYITIFGLQAELSFVGKFAPREGKEFEKNYRSMSHIIKHMYPEDVGSSLRGKSKQDITAAWNHAKIKYRSVGVPLAETGKGISYFLVREM